MGHRSRTFEMRARLQKYLPIFLVALLVQVLAPIGACWAAAVAAADPLSIAEICHSSGLATDQSTGHSGQHSEHDSGCSICCLVSSSALITSPTPVALAVPHREPAVVAWHDQTPDHSDFRCGSNT